MPDKLSLPDEQPIAINALRNMRAKLTGEIDAHQRQIDRLRTSLVHLDATLLLFDPEGDPEAIKPRRITRRSHYFAAGEQARRIYEAIRDHGSVSAVEVAVAAMADKSLPEADRKLRREFVGRFTKALQNQVTRGKLAKIGKGPGTRFALATAEPGLI
jgi:hypothetical protein